MPSLIIPALPCELVSIPNLLITTSDISLKGNRRNLSSSKKAKPNPIDTASKQLLPDLRIYQAGEDPSQGLHFALRDATIVLPVERKSPHKIYITFAFAFDSIAYHFLKSLNTRMKSLIQKARQWPTNDTNDSSDDVDMENPAGAQQQQQHIMDLFDEEQGTLRVLINRPAHAGRAYVPCQLEGDDRPQQIFQIQPSDRLLISVNLQHIWGIENGGVGNHQNRGVHSAFTVLKSIVILQ